jgi:hypothetical protein
VFCFFSLSTLDIFFFFFFWRGLSFLKIGYYMSVRRYALTLLVITIKGSAP